MMELMMPVKDPDENTVAIFKILPIPNPSKSLAAGRPIYDDKEVCEIRSPGSRNTSVQYATTVSHWVDDLESGEQRPVTYAERFSRQYRQFKEHDVQTKSGTPLDLAPFLTVSRRAELRALNIYTVEMLAAIDGQPLKNIGLGGRELKNQAQEYIEESLKTAPNLQLQAELEELRARNALLQEDNERIKAAQDQMEGEFAEMSNEQLWDFVTVNGGKAPLGKPNRKALVRMAQQLRQSDNAA
jgi:hypothetical protein